MIVQRLELHRIIPSHSVKFSSHSIAPSEADSSAFCSPCNFFLHSVFLKYSVHGRSLTRLSHSFSFLILCSPDSCVEVAVLTIILAESHCRCYHFRHFTVFHQGNHKSSNKAEGRAAAWVSGQMEQEHWRQVNSLQLDLNGSKAWDQGSTVWFNGVVS